MALSEETKSKFFCIGAITLGLVALLIGLIAGSFSDVHYYEMSLVKRKIDYSTLDPIVQHLGRVVSIKYDHVNSFFLMIEFAATNNRAWCARGFLREEFVMESEICLTPFDDKKTKSTDEIVVSESDGREKKQNPNGGKMIDLTSESVISLGRSKSAHVDPEIDKATRKVAADLAIFVHDSLSNNNFASYALVLRLRDGRRLWNGHGSLRDRMAGEREIVFSGEDEIECSVSSSTSSGATYADKKTDKPRSKSEDLVRDTASKMVRTICQITATASAAAGKATLHTGQSVESETEKRKELEKYLREELAKFKKRVRRYQIYDDDDNDSDDCEGEEEVKKRKKSSSGGKDIRLVVSSSSTNGIKHKSNHLFMKKK